MTLNHIYKLIKIKRLLVYLCFVLFLMFSQESLGQLGFCTGNSGDPIFTEDFGTGTTNNPLPAGTTTYPYAAGYPGDGFYTVSNGTFGNAFDWHQTQDHTVGDVNGKCLIVNAAASSGEFYRTTVSGLCETSTYEFSAWVLNLVIANSFCSTVPGGTIPINVRFEIWDSTDTNLLASGNTGDIVELSSPNWQEYGLVFQTLMGQNTVVLKMINNGLGGCGNDLAIDDIEFKSCGDTVIVSDSANNNTETLCSTQAPFSTILTATPDFTVYSSHFYQWQSSVDGGVTWNDLVGEINQTLNISVSNTTFFRAKVAEVAINLTNVQCVSFSNEYQITVNQLPTMPTLECWETAVINDATCSWEITGTQPPQPNIECWETATFNNTSCIWEVSGTQPVQPVLECWETSMFNNTTCSWEVSGTQPVQPVLECWETATFNNTSCMWEVSGTQPIQPVLECWQTATFDNIACSWEVSGTQPVQPTLECWETAIFNTNTCLWEVSGTRPGNTIEEDVEFCTTDDKRLTAQSNITNPSYLWNTGETSQSIDLNVAGIYTVEIVGGVCSFETRVFNVTFLETPIIDSVISEGRSIIVNTVNIGDFLYSLDGNIFQTDNSFFKIEGGLYTVLVKQRDCPEIIRIEHLHFFIPKFFTPNNDGINDTFNLGGIEFYRSSEVSIFNRYGKLMKFSKNSPFSWDGSHSGRYLPTDDYWYVIIIEGQKFTGHFTLKR